MICARLVWTGIRIDDAANTANAPLISLADSPIKVRIIPTDEERMIALHTLSILNGPQA